MNLHGEQNRTNKYVHHKRSHTGIHHTVTNSRFLMNLFLYWPCPINQTVHLQITLMRNNRSLWHVHADARTQTAVLFSACFPAGQIVRVAKQEGGAD